MRRNNKFKQFPKLEIVNSEGPILVAVKVNDHYVITDEDQEQVSILNDLEMISFAEGKSSIQDSRGRSWDARRMTVEKDDLLSFIGAYYKINKNKLIEIYESQFGKIIQDSFYEVINEIIMILENNPSLINKK